MMKASIKRLAPEFSASRMVLDYFDDAYAPAARRVQQLRLRPRLGRLNGLVQRSLALSGHRNGFER